MEWVKESLVSWETLSVLLSLINSTGGYRWTLYVRKLGLCFLDGEKVEEFIWFLKFVSVELWVVCLSICNFMKGKFSGSVRWTRVRSLFMMMMWLSWRTHMTHSWWVEKLLNVCRVDVTLWKVSAKWMSLWDGRELGLCSWCDWVEELIWSLKFVSVELWVVCLSRCNFMWI